MAAIAFDTLKFAQRLIAAGVPREQAEAQAEVMGEAFIHNTDALVTKDYMDEKLEGFITKSYLDEKLKNFVTKAYLDEKLKNFVTRDYLDVRLSELETRFESKLDQRFRSLSWMITVGFTVLVIPQLQALFS